MKKQKIFCALGSLITLTIPTISIISCSSENEQASKKSKTKITTKTNIDQKRKIVKKMETYLKEILPILGKEEIIDDEKNLKILSYDISQLFAKGVNAINSQQLRNIFSSLNLIPKDKNYLVEIFLENKNLFKNLGYKKKSNQKVKIETYQEISEILASILEKMGNQKIADFIRNSEIAKALLTGVTKEKYIEILNKFLKASGFDKSLPKANRLYKSILSLPYRQIPIISQGLLRSSPRSIAQSIIGIADLLMLVNLTFRQTEIKGNKLEYFSSKAEMKTYYYKKINEKILRGIEEWDLTNPSDPSNKIYSPMLMHISSIISKIINLNFDYINDNEIQALIQLYNKIAKYRKSTIHFLSYDGQNKVTIESILESISPDLSFSQAPLLKDSQDYKTKHLIKTLISNRQLLSEFYYQGFGGKNHHQLIELMSELISNNNQMVPKDLTTSILETMSNISLGQE